MADSEQKGDYDAWLQIFEQQLIDQSVPLSLWQRLYRKLENDTFDAGSAFAFAEDTDSNSTVLATLSDLEKHADIFLVDHLWTTESPPMAREQIETVQPLRERLAALLDLPVITSSSSSVTATAVLDRLWVLTGSYSVNGQELTYVLDEVGSRLQPPAYSEPGGAAFRCGLLYDGTKDYAVTVFWPLRTVTEGEIATCQCLPNGRVKWAALQNTMASLHVPGTGTPAEEGSEDSSADSSEDTDLAQLRAALVAANYTVAGVAAALGLDERTASSVGIPFQNVSVPAVAATIAAALPPEGTDVFSDVLRLFALNLPLTAGRIRQLLSFSSSSNSNSSSSSSSNSNSILHTLLKLDVLYGHEGYSAGDMPDSVKLVSAVQLTPIRPDLLIATDFAQTSARCHALEPVMHIGVDSLGLAGAYTGGVSLRKGSVLAAMPPEKQAVLDLCCGSGIQGIVALRHGAATAHFVDLSPRAVQFTNFNLKLNSLQRTAQVFTGDLYAALPRFHAAATDSSSNSHSSSSSSTVRKYDTILANPPYIANPSAAVAGAVSEGDPGTEPGTMPGTVSGGTVPLALFGDGGCSGETVLAAIIAGACAHLKSSGALLAVSNLMNPECGYGDKVKTWWLRQSVTSADSSQGTAAVDAPSDVASDVAVDVAVCYGRCWSAEQYAQLVLHPLPQSVLSARQQSGASTAADVASYAQALRGAGVQAVANGFVFCWRNGSGSSSSSRSGSDAVRFSVRQEAAELWQEAALLPCALDASAEGSGTVSADADLLSRLCAVSDNDATL